MKHCNEELHIKEGISQGKKMYYANCEICGMKCKNENKDYVIAHFSSIQAYDTATWKQPESYNTQLKKELSIIEVPEKKKKFYEMVIRDENILITQSSPLQDKKATGRMLIKNAKYILKLSGKKWDKIWSTEEGQESIANSLSEANSHAATLGEMGDLVPFGSICEFIANVECYKFALETGKNAPFKNIQITEVHENDIRDNDQVDGNFIFSIKRGIPRGEVVAIVVEGIRTDTGKNTGNIYDAKRLIEKAERHSPSYKSYLKDKEEFIILKTSGKLGKDTAGRECIVKNGQYGDYYVYESDLKSPYDGPDRPEMLRKAAGKSFFRPFMKIRNALAMAKEWSEDDDIKDDATIEQAADHVLDKAMGQFETEGHPTKDPQNAVYKGDNIKDAEIIIDEEKGVEKNDDREIDEI